MQLPAAFCWTKFGTESGESPSSIVERKEVERSMNAGVFLWGIGNSIRPSLIKLLEVESRPTVAFSPMKAPPRRRDTAPGRVLMWFGSVGMDGREFELPAHSIVTSRESTRWRRHFALVCERSTSLTGGGPIATLNPEALRNLVSGSSLGSSQVTSVVRYTENSAGSTQHYSVSFVARLAFPYLVELTDPAPIDGSTGLDSTPAKAREGVLGTL